MPSVRLEIVLDKEFLKGLKSENINWKEVLEVWNTKRKEQGLDSVNYPLFMYHLKNLKWTEKPAHAQATIPQVQSEPVSPAPIEKQESPLSDYPKKYTRITKEQVDHLLSLNQHEDYVIYVLGEKPTQPDFKRDLWEDKRMEILTHFDDLKD